MLMGMHAYQTNRSKGFVLMEHAMKTGKLRPKSRLLYAYLLVRNGELDEAVAALTVLGYSRQEAVAALAGACGTVEEMVKYGLKNLMKG